MDADLQIIPKGEFYNRNDHFFKYIGSLDLVEIHRSVLKSRFQLLQNSDDVACNID